MLRLKKNKIKSPSKKKNILVDQSIYYIYSYVHNEVSAGKSREFEFMFNDYLQNTFTMVLFECVITFTHLGDQPLLYMNFLQQPTDGH